MAIRLFNVFKIQERLLLLLNGSYDLRTNLFTGHWEQLTTPSLILSKTALVISQNLAEPSVAQTYTISAQGVINDVLITVPEGFQLSLNNSTWVNEITLEDSSGAIAETTIYVRMNAAAAGTFTGNITHRSGDTKRKNISLSGVCTDTGSEIILEEWFTDWHGGSYPYELFPDNWVLGQAGTENHHVDPIAGGIRFSIINDTGSADTTTITIDLLSNFGKTLVDNVRCQFEVTAIAKSNPAATPAMKVYLEGGIQLATSSVVEVVDVTVDIGSTPKHELSFVLYDVAVGTYTFDVKHLVITQIGG